MNRLLAEAVPLDNRLLTTDEEEYDRVATHVVRLFEKATDLATTNLETLEPSTQTIPYIFILNAHIDTSINAGKTTARQLPASVLPEGRFWPHISNLLLNFDPIQVRYVGRLFFRIIEIVAKGGEQTQDPVLAIQLLGNTILRLDPTSSTLTTTHYHYVRLCLMARAYAEATAVLDLPISHIPPPDPLKPLGARAYKYLCSPNNPSSMYLSTGLGLTQKITSRIYLEYFLMGGMCYMALGDYQKSLFFYEIVLVAPTIQSVASAVMLETYKKWLLVTLIFRGVDTDLPKSMSSNTVKIIRPLAKPYECLVEAFKSNRIERLQAEIQEGLEMWQSDGNYGLVHETLMAFRKFAVLRLGKIYAALTIEEVAERTSPDPTDVAGTLTYIQSLILSGQLHAEVVPPKASGAGTLRFGNTRSAAMPEVEVEEQMAIKTRELQLLMQHVSEYDHQLAISKDYIDWLQKLKAARDKEKKGAGAANRPVGFDMQDEDMMEDL